MGLGPYEGLEPADLHGVSKVDRCEIYSDPIGQAGHRCWQERLQRLIGGDGYVNRGILWPEDMSTHIDPVPVEQEK